MTARNYQNPNEETMQIKIKYHSSDIDKLTYVDGKSDWIDLRAAKRYHLLKGTFKLIDLGVSMEIPEGYEAIIAPRSSTFKKWGILQTNSIGVIDNSYSGDNDVWMMPVYATEETTIEVNDRICQFRIQKNQPKVVFAEVDHLDGQARGGFGSTGVQ
jgi:dUTP pyrophosphatase